MRIGVYFDMRNPAPWQRAWEDFYPEMLDLAAQAEAWGADSIWLSEHHLFADGYLPQPLTMAAAVAARTSRVRIGTAVLLAPLRPAIQIAEEAAIVDLISGGRLDLGMGAGYVQPEFEAYGASLKGRFDATDARVREVRELLDGDGITPAPLQRPFPIWLGYQGPKGAARAGRLGTGLLSLNPASLEPYTEGLAAAGHPPETARMAGVVSLLVADDPEEAYERVLPHLAHQLTTYREAGAAGSGRTPSPITPDKLRERRQGTGSIQPLEVHDPRGAVDYLRDLVHGLPVHEVYCWASVAGMPDDLVARHVELVCTTVRDGVADL